MLTVGSLFSGIGGIDLGLERAGMRVLWHSEIDPYASRVLKKHWPDVPNHGDITQIDFRQVQPVDVLAGGFPCQDISYAGRGAGLQGERSGLWYEFARAIREVGPRYVFVENVAALLVRGMDAVLGTLSDLGYDAQWSIVSACALGAPHMRKRLFLVAYPNEMGRKVCDEPFTWRPLQGNRMDLPKHDWNTSVARFLRMVDGLSNGVDQHRIAACGNAVVPQIPELIGNWIIEHARVTGYLERAA